MRAILADMQMVARAHEAWAMSPEATASEAATSHVFATQIREWMTVLGLLQSADAVDPTAASTGKPSTRVGDSSSSPADAKEP